MQNLGKRLQYSEQYCMPNNTITAASCSFGSKEPYNTALWTRKTRYVAASLVTDRHTHRTTTVTLRCMCQGLIEYYAQNLSVKISIKCNIRDLRWLVRVVTWKCHNSMYWPFPLFCPCSCLYGYYSASATIKVTG